MQPDLSGLEELGQETSEDQASSASRASYEWYINTIWTSSFGIFLATSGKVVTTLHRDGVSQSILLRFLPLSCDRREKSAVCIWESHFKFMCVCVQGKYLF